MKVVFLEEVEGAAEVGEVKEVRNGYARNFLLPRGLAAPATKENLQRAEKLAKAGRLRQSQLDEAARKIFDRIEGATITIEARVGEQGRLFGSVTAADIAERLSALAGEPVEHRQILRSQALRTLGTEEVRVRFTRNVVATVKVEVRAQNGGAESAATPEAAAAADAVAGGEDDDERNDRESASAETEATESAE